jgi:hypothetical protein
VPAADFGGLAGSLVLLEDRGNLGFGEARFAHGSCLLAGGYAARATLSSGHLFRGNVNLNLRRALLLFGTFTQHNSTFRENCRRVGVFE